MKYSLLIAGTRSGAGKTSLCLGLLAALQARGINVQPCKLGPDFIDPSLHNVITQNTSYNIDAWMGQEEGVNRVFARMHAKAIENNAQMLLAEGAMGLFDGAYGIGGLGSAAHAAYTWQLPVLLVLDVRSMGQSAVAVAAGFTRLRKNIPFAGIVCSHVGSSNHKAILEEAFATEFTENDPPILGYLPREGHVELKSRHLGLHMGHELSLNDAYVRAMGNLVEQHVNVEALLNSCTKFSPMLPIYENKNVAITRQNVKKQCIAIAYDAAFCFLYPDMPDVLVEMGAECVFFSPLNDSELPANCTAVYLPGGYPELYAQKLASNTSMQASICSFAENGGRIYAECGGYIYLMKELEYAGENYKLCNVLPISARVGERKAALGYRQVQFGAAQGRGHEFHYSQAPHTGLPPLWDVYDRQGMPLSGFEAKGVIKGNVMASWIHLYPEGSRELLAKIFDLS